MLQCIWFRVEILESKYLELNLAYTTYWLSDLRQAVENCEPHFFTCKMRKIIVLTLQNFDEIKLNT